MHGDGVARLVFLVKELERLITLCDDLVTVALKFGVSVADGMFDGVNPGTTRAELLGEEGEEESTEVEPEVDRGCVDINDNDVAALELDKTPGAVEDASCALNESCCDVALDEETIDPVLLSGFVSAVDLLACVASCRFSKKCYMKKTTNVMMSAHANANWRKHTKWRQDKFQKQ